MIVSERQREEILKSLLPLIRHILRRYRLNISVEDYEELESDALYAASRAIDGYDENGKTSLATFAGRYVTGVLSNWRQNRATEYQTFSRNMTLMSAIGKDDFNYEEKIEDQYNQTVIIENRISIDQIINSPKLSRKQRILLNGVLCGKTYAQIAISMGITRQRVGQLYLAAIDKLKVR